MFSKATLFVFLSITAFSSTMAKELTPTEDVFPAESLKTSTVGKEVNSHSEPKGKGLRGSIDENESSDMDVLSDERRKIKLDYK